MFLVKSLLSGNYSLHFWQLNTAPGGAIWEAARRGPHYAYENVTVAIWEELPRFYFPNQFLGPFGQYFRVAREAYRNVLPQGPHTCKPDVVLVKVQVTLFPYTANNRDVLWVECKAPNANAPHAWHDLVDEAVSRLHQAHPTRRVYLVLAFGINWIPLIWDPVPPLLNPVGSPLFIRSNAGGSWPVDRRLHIIPGHMLPGQRFIQQMVNGPILIDPTFAFSLDFWTLDMAGRPAF
ncbi:hypothetical protein PT974_05127 [Cladobotryum mycophilum]|uniref:GxxExxY protein n=1 Tax=Cladobotryum mycophilum TaxID=491253 RepID=A0ABR0SR36_9HYPO